MFFQVTRNIEASSTFDHRETDKKQLDTESENTLILRKNQRHGMKHEIVQGKIVDQVG